MNDNVTLYTKFKNKIQEFNGTSHSPHPPTPSETATSSLSTGVTSPISFLFDQLEQNGFHAPLKSAEFSLQRTGEFLKNIPIFSIYIFLHKKKQFIC